MAKKKKSKGALPKRVAGIKVPKAVRKGSFGQLLASKAGQALIAEAIMAAGALAGAKKAAKSPKARSFVQDAAETVREAGATDTVDVGSAKEVLAYALGEAARAFAEALRHGRDAPAAQENAEPDWRPADREADDAKKKHASYEAGPI